MKVKKEINKYSALILAGELNSIENFFLNEFFLNIGNKLAIERIIESLEFSNLENIYIAVRNIDSKYLSLKPFRNLNFIVVGKTFGVLNSIENAIEKIADDNISIIPITTIPDENKYEEKTCYFSKIPIPKENWSALKIDKSNQYEYLFKGEHDSYGNKSFPFTGRISGDRLQILNSIKKIDNNNMNDMLYLVKNLIYEYKYQIKFENWFDIGHKATYHQTKIESFTSRFFNNIFYEKRSNTIIKKSNNKEKILGEIYFYKNLPQRLRNYFPLIFLNKNEKVKKRELEIEFIPYPNLAELYLFKEIGPNAWLRIITKLLDVYNHFYVDSDCLIEDNISWLYSKKLNDRFLLLEKYINKSNNMFLKNFLRKEVYVNQKFKLCSLSKTFNEIKKFLLTYEKSVKQYIGHGDLCFNNILIDNVSGAIKLIDPKSFYNKKNKVYGLIDPNYDLSKLNHSFKYFYDCIVNNLYFIKYDDENIKLKIFVPKAYQYINDNFESIIINNFIDKNTLRVLTANLFISMLPLHIDDEDRMIALAIIGSIVFYDLDFNNLKI